jgi:hypothetical protein
MELRYRIVVNDHVRHVLKSRGIPLSFDRNFLIIKIPANWEFLIIFDVKCKKMVLGYFV